MSVYLRQTWIDPRLIFDKLPAGQEKIRLDQDYWRMLWVPDTFFRNEKKANFHVVTVPTRFFTLNTTSGSIWYTVK